AGECVSILLTPDGQRRTDRVAEGQGNRGTWRREYFEGKGHRVGAVVAEEHQRVHAGGRQYLFEVAAKAGTVNDLVRLVVEGPVAVGAHLAVEVQALAGRAGNAEGRGTQAGGQRAGFRRAEGYRRRARH